MSYDVAAVVSPALLQNLLPKPVVAIWIEMAERERRAADSGASSSRHSDRKPPRTSEQAPEQEHFRVNRDEVNQIAAQLRTNLQASGGGAGGVSDVLRLSSGKVLGSVVRERYEKYVQGLKENSPRILLVGDSGTGKSNCVNIVFGFHPDGPTAAEVRDSGRPCTQSFTQYGPTGYSPVRIIDSKGVEKMGVEGQLEELRKFLREACEQRDPLQHIHLSWYFVADRWQAADKLACQELRALTGVIIVIGKRDTRSAAGVDNLRAAIVEDLGTGIYIEEVGDPRGTRNWIPDSCGEPGHAEDDMEISLRGKWWQCEKEVGQVPETGDPIPCGKRGDDSPFGHDRLVKASLDLLPNLCRASFLTGA